MEKNLKNGEKEFQKRKPITIKDGVITLEELRQSTIISFITQPPGNITTDSVMLIVDNLDAVTTKVKGETKKFKRLDLFLNSTGGSIDAAYKIVKVCREYAEEFNVIVPLMAKSAATLICLGADEIVMPPVAELGPIDPIITHPSKGTPVPARSIRDFLELVARRDQTTETELSSILAPLIDRLDPWIVGTYETIMKISEDYARRLLSSFMLKKDSKKAEEVARILTREIPSHLYAINRTEAAEDYDLKILNVDPGDSLYDAIKQLFIIYTQFMNQNQIILLSGTRDINRFAQAITLPSQKGIEPKGIL
ncbi:MAG: peptidase [Spirochaetes bacterium]|nr:MAG: peptidase [Spirochaetota bacterium]